VQAEIGERSIRFFVDLPDTVDVTDFQRALEAKRKMAWSVSVEERRVVVEFQWRDLGVTNVQDLPTDHFHVDGELEHSAPPEVARTCHVKVFGIKDSFSLALSLSNIILPKKWVNKLPDICDVFSHVAHAFRLDSIAPECVGQTVLLRGQQDLQRTYGRSSKGCIEFSLPLNMLGKLKSGLSARELPDGIDIGHVVLDWSNQNKEFPKLKRQFDVLFSWMQATLETLSSETLSLWSLSFKNEGGLPGFCLTNADGEVVSIVRVEREYISAIKPCGRWVERKISALVSNLVEKLRYQGEFKASTLDAALSTNNLWFSSEVCVLIEQEWGLRTLTECSPLAISRLLAAAYFELDLREVQKNNTLFLVNDRDHERLGLDGDSIDTSG
jgi:hypothetical protein